MCSNDKIKMYESSSIHQTTFTLKYIQSKQYIVVKVSELFVIGNFHFNQLTR